MGAGKPCIIVPEGPGPREGGVADEITERQAPRCKRVEQKCRLHPDKILISRPDSRPSSSWLQFDDIVSALCRLIVMASHSRDSLLRANNLTGAGCLLCPRPASTRYSGGSFLTAGRTNWSCFNPVQPRTAPGPTSCCRDRPRRPRTALWPRPSRLSPPARMTMTGAHAGAIQL